MQIRTFWLNLGWLVMLVVTIAIPLMLDAFGRLTYFTSLGLWGIPILYLWPVFNMITAEGTGRRRRALRWSAGMIVVLGIVLDFLFGHLTLRFPGCSEPAGASPYLLCLPAVRGSVPVEELLFYAMGPVAMVLVYACADERWLSRYNPKDDLLNLKLIQLSPRLLTVAIGAALTALVLWRVNGSFPTYFVFLAAGAVLPAMFLYRTIGNSDELASVCGHRVVRSRHVADLGGDARHPTAVVELRTVRDDRADYHRMVAWGRNLSC